ncbi:MAG TPA: DUF488 domain-containing protein [Bryobacteraceae bacterium]|nr:DUF488 domain-containing protein [Bryobacteraceae bacterium]
MSKACGESGGVLTIGHSNRPLADLLEMLTAHGVELLIDVRTVPRSRHNPQFNRESLPASLAAAGIQYLHMPGLGGLRHARKDSINAGWRNPGFRGFADYMQTPEFAENLAGLERLGQAHVAAIMCAESLPWRCHRSLIADALTVRGIPVRHIMAAGKADLHHLTAFARVEGARITYPPADLEMFRE